MPIDPKKFKQIVTNHLEKVTEAEFLDNLQKAAPYLFKERTEKLEETARHDNLYCSENSIDIEQIRPSSTG